METAVCPSTVNKPRKNSAPFIMEADKSCINAVMNRANTENTINAKKLLLMKKSAAKPNANPIMGKRSVNRMVVSENAIYWYDGKTMWTYIKDNHEVNVSTPTITEQQTMNPYLFLNLYKKGYVCECKGTTNIRGKECYSMRLAATSSAQKIQEMLLEIDKTTYHPLSIRMRTGKNKWTRIRIMDYKTKQKFKSEIFKFNPQEYPDAEVIDLR